MGIIIWLVVGGLVGWVASLLMGTSGRQGCLLNVVVGIVGAFIAGYFIAPYFNTGTINQGDFSLSGLVVSLLGAMALLLVVKLIRRA